MLFILVPLTFLAFLSSLGMFESDGGVEKLRERKGWLSRIVFFPLTYKAPKEWTHDMSRMLMVPMAILFYIMSCTGYAQYLCSNTTSRVVTSVFAVMCSVSIYVAVAA